MAKPKKNPFAVDFSKAAISETDFTNWLVQQVLDAQNARAAYTSEGGLLDLFHLIYDQGAMPGNGPWPGSANLTSWIGTVQVDAMTSRVAKAVCGVEPVCTVDGWSESPERVGKVEAFHEWKAVDERLRPQIRACIELGLIEGTAFLEVDERAVMRHVRRTIKAVPEMDEFGALKLDGDGKAVPQIQDGEYVQVTPETQDGPTMDVLIEERNYACDGPQYRLLGGKDGYILPGHARNDSEVWGFAKRIYLRPVELKQREAAGTYRNIDQLSLSNSDREQRMDETRRQITIEPQDDQTVQKELWEIQLSYDIDDDGADEWLVATISIKDGVLLRLDYDQIKQMRFVAFRPFPDPTWVYGRSLIQKLISLIYEHTSERNMIADKSAMAVSAPLSRLTTAYWNPDDQPIGPQAVIDVRSHDELKQVVVSDVSQSMIYLKRDTENAAERVGGVGDMAVVGVDGLDQNQANPTATQVQTVAQAAAIRVEDVIESIRNSVEDVYMLRQTIWERSLANHPQGMKPPDDVLKGMETRGISMGQDNSVFAFTAADLAGRWRFKPKGSLQSSNKQYLLQNVNGLMAAVMGLAKLNPQMQQSVSGLPFIKAMLDHYLQLYDVSDKAAILKSLAPPPMPEQPPLAPGAIPPQLVQALQAMPNSGAPAPVGVQ